MSMEVETSETIQKLPDRLGDCEVCGTPLAKYTCPKCEVKTCSLKCVNIHKKELECNGIRDPTKFITLNKFTNIDLLNDYRMLEEMTRNVESLGKKLPKDVIKNGKKIIPKRMHKLKIALQDRTTCIEFLPQNFEKHKMNQTYYHIQNKEVLWSIEFIFVNADNLKIYEHRISENKKITSIIHKYITGECESFFSDKLQFYQSAGFANLCFYLRAEKVRGEKYLELDGSESLKSNLENKIIIEYPTIFVVNKEHSLIFEENCILNEKVEMDSQVEVMETDRIQRRRPIKNENTANEVLSKILKEEEKEEEKKNKKSKNLLFITEDDMELSSDEDL